MELKTIYGDVIIALDTAKTALDLVLAAIAAKKSLRSADLRYADLRYANLSYADLSYANLSYANLSYANLSYANLSYADLSSANLRSADLSYANLSYADLSYANLSSADLSSANLRSANLRSANLRSANLSYADLSSANLSSADLSSADLSSANLRYANLSSADLSSAKNAELAIARIQFIPESGSFVGWKKCRDGVIVRLLVGKTAKRSHGAERKCRASRVKVAEVFGAEFGVSLHDSNVLYREGEIVEPLNGWGEDRWEVCAPGIHFYLTRAEAEAHV